LALLPPHNPDVGEKAEGMGVAGAAAYVLAELSEGGGKGVERSESSALRYYRLSASLGNATAQHAMSHLHSTGALGATPNQGVSALFDYFAVLGGSAPGAMALGYRHMFGRGVPKRCETARLYYEMAANAAADAMDAEMVPVAVELERITDNTKVSRYAANDELVQFYYYSADKVGDGDGKRSTARFDGWKDELLTDWQTEWPDWPSAWLPARLACSRRRAGKPNPFPLFRATRWRRWRWGSCTTTAPAA
jgi:hypothetical protein